MILDEKKLKEVVNAQKIILSLIKEKFPDNKGEDFIYINMTLQLVVGMKLKDFDLGEREAEAYLEEFAHNAKIFFREGGDGFLS